MVALASTLGAANPFRYRSYYFDSETGLYYCNARYYNAEWGRWVSADIATMAGADKNLLGTNIFAYCYNNPVMYRDPDGHLPWWLNDFLRGLKDGFVGTFTGIWYSIIHPLQTLKSIFSLKQMINNVLDPIGLSNAAKIIYYIAICNFYKAGYTYGGVLGQAAIIAATYAIAKGFQKVKGKMTTVKSRGSTGRTVANNLKEKLAMQQVQSDPLRGAIKLRFTMNDPRWPASEGWAKYANNVNGVEIHFNYSSKLGMFDDFKFN